MERYSACVKSKADIPFMSNFVPEKKTFFQVNPRRNELYIGKKYPRFGIEKEMKGNCYLVFFCTLELNYFKSF